MGNMIDPFKSGLMPLTEEIYITQKKIRKESGLENKSSAEVVRDLSHLSAQANNELENGGLEEFMESASNEISRLDSNSSKFMQEAIGKVVSSALEQEFGKGLTTNKGFEKMKDELIRQLLGDPEKRVTIENYISMLQQVNDDKKSDA